MEVDVPIQNNARPANKLVPVQSPYVKIPGPADNTRPTYDDGTDTLKRARARINQGPIDDDTDSRTIMMLPGHRTEVFVCAFNPTKHAQLATGYARLLIRQTMFHFLTYE